MRAFLSLDGIISKDRNLAGCFDADADHLGLDFNYSYRDVISDRYAFIFTSCQLQHERFLSSDDTSSSFGAK